MITDSSAASIDIWIAACEMAEKFMELVIPAKAGLTATGSRSCRAFHDAQRPVQAPVLRRRHCRKEIRRKHDRQFPAIRAAMRAAQ